jgi:hypothetical protein
MKPALTVTAVFIDTTQLPVPVQAPPHPLNVYPPPAVAARVTELPAGKDALQLLAQLIPAGFDCTCPVPLKFTVRALVVAGGELNG